MQRLTWIAVFILLGVSYTSGQDGEFLGLPDDFDIFGFDTEDDTIFKAREFKYESNTNTGSEELLRKVCEEYDLQINNEKLDCQSIRTVPKTLKEHNIQKREADETPLEGSGEPYEESPSETQEANNRVEEPASEDKFEPAAPYEEIAVKEGVVAEVAPIASENQETGESDVGQEVAPEAPNDQEATADGEAAAPVPEETNQEDSVNTDAEKEPEDQESQSDTQDTPNVEEQGNNETQEGPAPDSSTDEANFVPAVPYGEESDTKESPPVENNAQPEEKEVDAAEPAPENPIDESAANQETPDQAVVPQEEETNNENQEQPTTILAAPYDEGNAAAPSNAEENSNSAVQPPENTDTKSEGDVTAQATGAEVTATENPLDSQDATTASVVKKGRILKPNANDENKESETNNSDQTNESEKVHEHQSGNAVINSPESETLEGSESVVKKMSPMENIKESSNNSDLPKSGESSEETQQGRKDTKVLIVLLVAVVVIGGAAFAYNFIKKRKQKKSEAAVSENGGSTNLQRVAAADKDPERGTELKPLMKSTEQKPAVEYKDEKENPKIEVTN